MAGSTIARVFAEFRPLPVFNKRITHACYKRPRATGPAVWAIPFKVSEVASRRASHSTSWSTILPYQDVAHTPLVMAALHGEWSCRV